MSKNILVTGGLGTLGTPLVSALRKDGHSVFVIDLFHDYNPQSIRCDVGNYRQLERTFESLPIIDTVYHLAAEFGRNNGEDYYEQLWRTNVIGTKNIIRLQEKLDYKMIFASSSEVYGELPEGVPYKEDTPIKYPLKHFNDYAMSKWINEKQITNSMEQNGTKSMILRFFNAYGPGEHYSKYRSVVCLFIYRLLTDQKITVYQNYHRVFQFIDDFISTLKETHNKFKSGEVYNIGGSEYTSVEELANSILSITSKPQSLVELIPREKANVTNKLPDISKAIRDLGHSPITPLSKGLPITVNWMKEAYGL